MQAFLGLVNYLRHFIPCLATMAAPLDELRNAKSIDVDDINVWTPQCQDAFLSIKDAVASAPTLCKPDWREPFLVATDASAVGLGCVLFQGSREAPRYICCASRSLTASERNYAATKKELLAIVFSLRKLRFYLAGRRFHLYTDHKALSFMFTQKGLNPMLERWLDELLEFDFSVEHLPGVLNVLPDHLSRLYSIASSEDFAARARDAALRAPAPARVAGLIRLDWKSVVVDDWVPCPGSALGGGGAAPDPDFEEIREPRRGVSVLTPQCLTGAGMLVGSVAQGVDKDDVPPLVEAPASAEPALDSHPLLAAVDLQDLASDVPPHKREALLREAHMAGHKGAKATLARLLSEGHKWPGMAGACQRVARECIDCQRYTVQRYGFHPQRAILAALPMDHLAMDLFSLPTSSDGYNYVLLVVDVCTRFAWLYPLKTKTGDAVTRRLRGLFYAFGKPSVVQSDNGTEFANMTLTGFLRSLGAEHRRTSPYHPQGNGVVERLVRTVKESIFAMLRGDTASWPGVVPEVQYFYNTTVHSRHGSTPFSLFFARPHTPLRGEGLKAPLFYPTVPQMRRRLQWMTEVVFPAIESKSTAFAKRMHADFMKRHRIIQDDFPAGALVMRQQIPRLSKAHPAWEGPYIVVRRTQGGAYILRNTLDEELSHRVPVNQLRLVSMEGNLSPDSFEVEKVVDHRGAAAEREYLVKWRNFSSAHNTWEPTAHFDSLACIADYWKSKVVDLSSRAKPATPQIEPNDNNKDEPATPAIAQAKKSPPTTGQGRSGAPRAKHPPRAASGGPSEVAPPRVTAPALNQGVAKKTRRVHWPSPSSRGAPPKRGRRV
jgi:transposase InsO family protein